MSYALPRARLAPVCATFAMAVWPELCLAQSGSFMDPGGPIAAAERAHFISVAAITMTAVLPVLILVPLLLWRYRYGNRAANYAPKWDFSLVLDVMMWVSLPRSWRFYPYISGKKPWRSTRNAQSARPSHRFKFKLSG